MTHRGEHTDAVVLGRIRVPDSTTETTQVHLEHRPRDTVWREDDQQAYLGSGPRAMAGLRNLALDLFSIHGVTKINETVQAIGRRPTRATPLIT
ncbi:hypothetical protein [Actinomadura sp. NPDC000600]|uniref:hypothetical protein n=1 Tax=Actinomadura sp. NPDC000600 TaxID=3154262 RepID=UPI003391FF6B